MSTVYAGNNSPVRGSAFTFLVALVAAGAETFQDNPTLAAGDVRVSKDGGSFSNIASLPTAIDGGSALIVALIGAEMTADYVTLSFHDAAGDEWQDLFIYIETVTDQAEDVIDEVWDELQSGHTDAGSFGKYLDDEISDIPAEVLGTTVPGSYASTTVGGKIGTIGTAQISVVSPVASDGDVETYQGDDYNDTDGRALEWADSDGSWPSLTSATIAVIIGGVVELVGSVVDANTARLELTATQTAAITAKEHPFQVVATLASARVVTLVEGTWTSKRRVADS